MYCFFSNGFHYVGRRDLIYNIAELCLILNCFYVKIIIIIIIIVLSSLSS